jgi:dTDP-4-amino-4,6-dideoxygalactose transaminase
MVASSLAILGGRPAFRLPVVVGRPYIGERRQFEALAAEILDRRWLTNNGPVLQAFEQRLVERLDVDYCVAMSNGTLALELAYEMAGLTGEVIVPAFTFVATVHALRRANCTPVFCDIDPQTYCLDASAVTALLTPRTGGIVGVHTWGHACDCDRLQTLADGLGIPLVFDSAHAFGSSYHGDSLAKFGTAAVFSFHATKVLHTFEGGAVATSDGALAERLRQARNFGFCSHDQTVGVGTNAKLTELSAAMGLVNLQHLDEFIAVNKRNYLAYCREFAGIQGIRIVRYAESERYNFHYAIADIDAEQTGLSRDALLATLWAENIRARRYFWPGVHLMEPYRSKNPDAAALLPHTNRAASRVLALPTGADVDEAVIGRVADVVRVILKNPRIVGEAAEAAIAAGRIDIFS